MRTALLATCCALVALFVVAASANASYPVTGVGVSPSITKAGQHPNVTYTFNANAATADNSDGDDLKSLTLELPPGFLGNPQAPASKCTDSQFNSNACPSASQIGTFNVTYRVKGSGTSGTTVSAPGKAFMMQPATVNDPIAIGFIIVPADCFPIFIKQRVGGIVGVRAGTDADYGANVVLDGFPRTIKTKLFGITKNATVQSISSVINAKAPNGKYFNFNPTRCGTATTKFSWTTHLGASGTANSSFTLTDCAAVTFNPTATAAPTNLLTGATTGMSATFTTPTADATTQGSHVKTIQTDLPLGTGLDFPALGGVDTCPVADLNADACTALHPGSKVGTATTNVPFLSAQMTGDIYLVQNSSNFLFGYVLRGPNQIKAMLLIKMTSEIDPATNEYFVRAVSQPSPGTLPQAPWSTATLNFTTGMIKNPVCNPNQTPQTGTITHKLTPWSGNAVVTKTNTVTYTKPSGGCGPVNTAPTVDITAPTDGSSTPNATTTLNFTVSDAQTPSGPFTCTFTNGQSISLSPGVNTIAVSCTDPGGLSGSDSVTITRLMPPVVQITSPNVNPAYVTSSPTNIAYTVGGSSTIPGGTACAVGNLTTGTTNASTTPPTNSVALQSGPNTIRVSCTNSAGTTNVDTVVNLGSVPAVDITSPATNPFSTPNTSINIAYQVDGGSTIPSGGCTVANTTTGTSASSSSTATNTVNLQMGNNTIAVTCANSWGSSSDSTVVVRGTGPSVTITAPATDPAYTTAATYDLVYSTTGSPTCVVTNTTTGVVGDPTALNMGANNIQVVCTNAFGSSTDTVVINRGVLPTVTITDPAADPFSTSSATYDIAYTTTGSPTCTVTNTTTGVVGDPVALQTGNNLITVSCTNVYGSAADTTTIIRGTGPTVNITTPNTDPAFTTASTFDIVYTATGSPTCTVTNTTTGVVGDPVALNVGANAIVVSCTDAFGTGTDTVTINRGTAPTVTITDPATDPFSTTAATYDIAYTSTGTAPVSCTVTNTTTGVVGDPVALQSGNNTISVTCTNSYGSAVDTTVIVRGTAPTVNITAPATDPAYVTTATYDLVYSTTGSPTCTVTNTTTGVVGDPVALNTGANNVSVSCSNAFGSATDTVVINRGTAPTISLTDPGITPFNTTAASYDIAYTVGGTPPVTCVVTNTTTGVVGDPITLAVGTNNIQIVCTNLYGSASLSFVINRGTAPTVTITAPATDPAFTAAATYDLVYSTTGTAPVTCTVTNTTTGVVGDPTTLNMGANNIQVVCTNAFGTATDTVVINRGTAPTVTITDPATDPFFTTAASYDIGYTTTGAPTCVVNNTTSGATGDPIALQSGTNSISVVCTNAYGSATDTTVIDRGAPPTVNITAPATDPAFVTTATYDLVYATTGSPTCTVTNLTTSAVGDPINLNVGANNIQVVCTNAYGSATDTVTINRGTAPSVTITAPATDPAFVTAATYDLVYTSGGTAPVTCVVTNTTTGVAADPVALNVGANLVQVVCTNAYGSATDTVTINRGTAPTVTITDPATDPFSTTAATYDMVYGTTGTAPVTCTVTNTTTGATGDPIALQVGTNNIQVSCSNSYGTATDSTVINRGSGPSVTITDPATDPAYTTAATYDLVYSTTGSPTCVVTNLTTGVAADPIALNNGPNNIQVVCTNAFGSATDTVTINRGIAPAVLINIPNTDPAYVTTASTNVGFTNNGNTTLDVGVTCTVSNTTTGVTNPSTTPATNSVNLNNGPNTISVTCTSPYGSSTDTTVIHRGAAPTVVITTPATDPSTSATTPINVAYTVNGGSTIPVTTPPTTCTVANTATGVSGPSTTPNTNSVALQNGANTIQVSCSNAFGTGSDTTVVNYGNIPAVVITAPLPNPSYTTAASTNVSYTVFGNPTIPVTSPPTTCVVENLTTGSSASSTDPTTNNVNLNVGANNLRVSCTNQYGTGQDTVTVNRGSIPVVDITTPATSPSYTTNSPINVAFTVNGVASIPVTTPPTTCTVNTVATSSATSNSVNLVSGSNTITVACTNAYGTGTDAVVVNLGVAPTVTITDPASDPFSTTAATYDLVYSSTGTAPVNCTVTNTTTGVVGDPVALNNGPNNVSVTCTNLYGTATDTVTINRGSGPSVTITAPATDPAFVTTATYDLVYSTTGSPTCVVTNLTTGVAGDPITLNVGANNIQVVCTNAFGSATDTVTINRGSAPTVSITDPATDPLNTTAATYDIAFTSTGTAPVTCTVTNTSTSTTGDPVTLQVGTNNIQVSCSNAYGTATDTTVINRGTAPTVTITAPATDPAFVTTATYDLVYTSTGTAPVTCVVTNLTTSTVGDPITLNVGANNIQVVCTNAFGSATDTVTINRGTAPTVTITAPATDPAFVTTATYDLVYSTTGTAPVTCVVTNLTTSTVGDPITLNVGANNIQVVCTNSYGSATDTVTINRGTAPTVTITDPATDPLNTTAATYDIAYTSGGTAPVTCVVTNTTTGVVGDPVTLQSGANNIQVVCTNSYGSATDTTVINRGTAPTVTITDPATDPAFTTAATYDLVYSTTGSPTCTVTNTTTSVVGDPVALNAGANNITVSCTNAFGSATDTVVINRGTAPTVTITDPATDPAFTTAATYDLVYSTTGTAPVTCVVTNLTTSAVGDPVTLNVGANNIQVVCTNAYGSATDTVTINRGTAPTVTITTPATDPAYTTAATFNVGFSSTGTAPVTCVVTNTTTGVSGNPVALNVGANNVQVVCTNSYGSASDTVVINRGTAPTVTITDPATDPFNTTAATYNVVYSSTGTAPVTCVVTNLTTSVTGNPVTLNVGTNNIQVVCTNLYGSATDTVTINRGTAPTVTITDPASDPFNTTAPTYDIAYTTTGTAPVTCTVTNTTTSATGDPIALQVGTNNIQVSCSNAFGSASDSTVINRGTAPTVNITDPATSPITVSTSTYDIGYASTGTAPVTCVVTNTTTTVVGDPVALQLGSNIIQVTCTNAFGSASDTTEIIRDSGPPPTAKIDVFASPSTGTPAAGPAGGALVTQFSLTGSSTAATGFECRVPAVSATWGACTTSSPTAGDWTIPTAGLTSGNVYAYEVRAVNGSTPGPVVSGSFWYDNSTWTATPSVVAQPNAITPAGQETQAGRHPNVAATITLQGWDDPSTLYAKFPDGLMGSLSSIPDANRCTLAQANSGTCPLSSRIGNMSGTATSARDGSLSASGTLYLVRPADVPSQYAAGVALEMTAPNGLGQIRGLGYIGIRNEPQTTPANTRDGARNMFLEITSIPNSTVTGTGTETRPSARRFHINTATVTVDGTIGSTGTPSTNRPLITNPHYCGATAFNTSPWIRPDQKRFVGSGTGYAGSSVANVTANYNVTCTTQAFNPTLTFEVKEVADSTWTNAKPAGTQIMVRSKFSVPEEAIGTPNATIARASVQLPPSIAADIPSIGATSEQCGTNAALPSTTSAGYVTFIPGTNPATPSTYCPPGSIVGTAYIKTPMVPNTVVGKIYAVNAPVPNLGIWVDPSISPTNPQGVSFGIYARTVASAIANDGDGSINSIQLNLNSIPDIPVTELELIVGDNPSRGGVLGQTLMKVVEQTDTGCRPSPEDTDIGYPAYPDPWDLIARFRPWSNISSASNMLTTGTGDLFANLPNSPLNGLDTERRIPFSVTDCVAHS